MFVLFISSCFVRNCTISEDGLEYDIFENELDYIIGEIISLTHWYISDKVGSLV